MNGFCLNISSSIKYFCNSFFHCKPDSLWLRNDQHKLDKLPCPATGIVSLTGNIVPILCMRFWREVQTKYTAWIIRLTASWIKDFKLYFLFIALRFALVDLNCFKAAKVLYEPNVRKYLLTCAPNEDSNQPAHPRSLIRVFVVHKKILWILGYPKRAQRRFWSDCANAQADLNLRWAHMCECTFSDVVAHMECEKGIIITGACLNYRNWNGCYCLLLGLFALRCTENWKTFAKEICY